MERALIDDFRAIWRWRGRAPRRQYWMAVAAAGVAAIFGVGIVVASLQLGAEALGFLLGVLLIMAGCIPLGVTTMRRLRDRNRPPAWIALIVAPGLLGDVADWLGWDGAARAVVLLAAAAIWVLSVVELGFLPGTRGRNRFGDDPLEPSSAEVFS